MLLRTDLSQRIEVWYVAVTGGIIAGLVSWPLYGTAGKQHSMHVQATG